MEIFEQEIQDGLREKISDNSSISFQVLPQIIHPSIDDSVVKKAIAGYVEDGRNFDLYHISSILASVGPNKNDDWFLPEEIWAARETPIYKQVNFGHNEKDIIGVITDTALLGKDGEYVTSIDDIAKISDIVSHAVIWSYWEDDDLKARMEQIISDIENNKLFVSMESLFKNFDYVLVDESNAISIVKRTKETAFLSKYLRIYNKDADGTYQGRRIYRLLRNFTFSGKALVENPANGRSIISDVLYSPEEASVAKDESKSSASVKPLVKENLLTKSLAESIMENPELVALKAELTAAKAELEAFKKSEAEKVIAEITELKASNDSLTKQVAELTQLAQAAKDAMDKEKVECEAAKKQACAEKDMMKEECEAKVAEAEKVIAALKTEKVKAERLAKLASVNVDSAKAEEIMSTWASVSDDHFSKVVELYAVNKSAASSASTDTQDGLDSAKASANTVNPNAASEAEKAVASERALAEKIAAQFKFNKNKSEKK